jgi:hypothetical protein
MKKLTWVCDLCSITSEKTLQDVRCEPEWMMVCLGGRRHCTQHYCGTCIETIKATLRGLARRLDEEATKAP